MLIRGTRQRIEYLERLMLSEIENIDKDPGWNATTLIEEFGKLPPQEESS